MSAILDRPASPPDADELTEQQLAEARSAIVDEICDFACRKVPTQDVIDQEADSGRLAMLFKDCEPEDMQDYLREMAVRYMARPDMDEVVKARAEMDMEEA